MEPVCHGVLHKLVQSTIGRSVQEEWFQSEDITLCGDCFRLGSQAKAKGGHGTVNCFSLDFSEQNSGRETTQEQTLDAYLPHVVPWELRDNNLDSLETAFDAWLVQVAAVCGIVTGARGAIGLTIGGGALNRQGLELRNLMHVAAYTIEEISADLEEAPTHSEEGPVSPMIRVGRALEWLKYTGSDSSGSDSEAKRALETEEFGAAPLLVRLQRMLPKPVVVAFLTHDVVELRAAMATALHAVLTNFDFPSASTELIMDDLSSGLAAITVVQIVSAVNGDDDESRKLQKWLLSAFRSWIADADSYDRELAETTLGDDLGALLDRQQFCDVMFTCSDCAKVGAHECVLAIRCPLLAQMINTSSRTAGEMLNFEVAVSSEDFRAFLVYLYADRLPHISALPDNARPEDIIKAERNRVERLFGLLRCSLEFTVTRVGKLAAQNVAVAITSAATTTVQASMNTALDDNSRLDAQRAGAAAIMQTLQLGGEATIAAHFPAVLSVSAAAFCVTVRPVPEINPSFDELNELSPTALAAILRSLDSGADMASAAAIFDSDVPQSTHAADLAKLFVTAGNNARGESLTDCTVSAGSGDEDSDQPHNRYAAHRAILTARCRFFEGAFNESASFAEATDRHISVSHLSLDRSVHLLLDFIYNGELTVWHSTRAASSYSDSDMGRAMEEMEEANWRDVLPAAELLAALPFFQVANSARLYGQLRDFLASMVRIDSSQISAGKVDDAYWSWGTSKNIKRAPQIAVSTSDSDFATGAKNTVATRNVQQARNPAVMSERSFVKGRVDRCHLVIRHTGAWFGVGICASNSFQVEGGSVLGTQPCLNGSLHYQSGVMKLQMRGETTQKVQATQKLVANDIVCIRVDWAQNCVFFDVNGVEIGKISSSQEKALSALSGQLHVVAALSYQATIEFCSDPQATVDAVSFDDSNPSPNNDDFLSSFVAQRASHLGAKNAKAKFCFQATTVPAAIRLTNGFQSAERFSTNGRNPAVCTLQAVGFITNKIRVRIDKMGTWAGFGVAEFPAYQLVGGSVLGTQQCFNASYHIQSHSVKLQMAGSSFVKKLPASPDYVLRAGDVLEIEVDRANDCIKWRKNPGGVGNAAQISAPPPPPQPAQTVQWEWEDDQARGWKPYDAHTNGIIEAAFSSSQASVALTHGFFSAGYTIDFKTMKQTKTSSGWQRNVQRTVTGAAAPPVPVAPIPAAAVNSSSPPEVQIAVPVVHSFKTNNPKLHFVIGLSLNTQVSILP